MGNNYDEKARIEAIAGSVRSALAKLNRRLRAQDDPGGVGSTGLALLGRLLREGPSTASALAAAERLQPQSLTRTLAAMEARKLIARMPDDDDRRRSTIVITEEGVEILRRTVRNRQSWLARAMAATLSDTERDLVRLAATLFERLADAVEEVDAEDEADE